MSAWDKAKELIGLLPHGTVWCFNITELQDDAVLNIYAPKSMWLGYRLILFADELPGCIEESDKDSITWYLDGLAVSLVTPEEEDGRDEPV